MLDFSSLNWLAILAVAALGFVLGGLYYSPLLFANAWMRELGKKPEDFQGAGAAFPFVLAFVTALVTATVIGALVHSLDVTTLFAGAALGLLCGLGFVSASTFSDFAFCRFSMKLAAIQSGYRVLYCVLMGAILAVWR
jgi:hypothetical protein